MTEQFATPSTPSGLDLKELNGSLLLIEVLGVEQEIPTVHGNSSAIRANVTPLDGASAGVENDDVLVFPRVLQSQLRGKVGQKVLGRLGQGVAKPGQTAPWTLAAATPEDVQKAQDYTRTKASGNVSSAEAPF